MPIITFSNSKGGCGKTTESLLLACELARDASVVLIDADPAQRAMNWAEAAQARGALPESLSAIESGGWKRILDEMEEAQAAANWVVVDLEGGAARVKGFAMRGSDLVVVPSQETPMDAEDALGTLEEIRIEGKGRARPIPAIVAISRTRLVGRGRTARTVNAELRASAPVLRTEVVERDAYAAMFSFSLPLRDLPPDSVGNLPRAIENAEAFVTEIQGLFQGGQVRVPEPEKADG